MKRAVARLLLENLATFPCVAILGMRQCGKTTLLGFRPRGRTVFDLERRADYTTIARDPDTFRRLNPRRVAIDEAQQLPSLFPALRVAIDARRKEKGRFVITGSSSPDLVKEISESLARRVGVSEQKARLGLGLNTDIAAALRGPDSQRAAELAVSERNDSIRHAVTSAG